MVIELIRDEQELVICCVIEAILSKRTFTLPWQNLRSREVWHQGWN
ncbi:TIGR02450 family Trp-rich protein [Nitrincola sp. MINF-07-Sa-05]